MCTIEYAKAYGNIDRGAQNISSAGKLRQSCDSAQKGIAPRGNVLPRHFFGKRENISFSVTFVESYLTVSVTGVFHSVADFLFPQKKGCYYEDTQKTDLYVNCSYVLLLYADDSRRNSS